MRDARDILASPLRGLVVFWLPAVAMIVAGGSWVSSGWRTVVWTVALAILGTGCIVNALRCGRIHCYITGPFFLLMAVITLLYGLDILLLGRHGWNAIGATTLIGAIVLCCIPEMVFGKYRKSRRSDLTALKR